MIIFLKFNFKDWIFHSKVICGAELCYRDGIMKTRLATIIHVVPFVIKTIRIASKVRLHCNKTRFFRPITILITNQTKPPIDLACFDCLRQTETALDSLAGNSNAAEFERLGTH